MQGILELLQQRGLRKAARTKIVRHKDHRYPIEQLIANGDFEAGYQAYQSRHVFDCDQIISCIGLEGVRARFFGVYEVAGRRPATEVPLPEHLQYLKSFDPAGWIAQGQVWYDLQRVNGFEDLENRVIIDWGPGARSWVQWAKLDRDKPIIEVLDV